ncbi:MAG TPA: DUF488 domain-containing protein [Methanospirillum sp.]|nr:DUF488 domain-containing protein [Methanospirillum sp.]
MVTNASDEALYQILTIGYAGFQVESFISILHQFGVPMIVDIRTAPYSRVHPDFCKNKLKRILDESGIAYVYLGRSLGGKYTDPAVQFPEGGVSYARVATLPTFMNGLAELIQISQDNPRCTLLCVERDPCQCHRFTLVSHELSKIGVSVGHIQGDGTIRSNRDLEEGLQKRYGIYIALETLYEMHNHSLFKIETHQHNISE